MTRGERISGFALSEPTCSLNIRTLKARAQKVDGGWKLNGSNPHITNVLGIARAKFYSARSYTDERIVASCKFGDYRVLAHRAADTSAKIKAGNRLFYHSAWQAGQATLDNAIATREKVVTTETAVRFSERATRIRGGPGMMREYPVGQTHHDAFVYVIEEGTSDVKRSLISHDLGLKP